MPQPTQPGAQHGVNQLSQIAPTPASALPPSSVSQVATGISDSPMKAPPKPVEPASVPGITASRGDKTLPSEPAISTTDEEQIAAPESPPATFLRQPRIEFTEMPPTGLQNRIGPFSLPPESVVARPARITPGSVTMESPVERRRPADTVQQPSSRPAKRLQSSSSWSDAREARAAEPAVAVKMPQEKTPLRLPAQQVLALPAQDTRGVLDTLATIASPRRFENWAGKKEESGGLSIGNLEIQIIQEDAPAAVAAAPPPSPALADDWDMDRRYVRRLG